MNTTADPSDPGTPRRTRHTQAIQAEPVAPRCTPSTAQGSPDATDADTQPSPRPSNATDARNTVTLVEDGTPWPIRFHFLRLGDTEKPDWTELVNVGFEIGEPRFDPGELKTMPEPIDAVTLQRIANNYASYLEIARQSLVLDQEGTEGAIKRLRGPSRKPARLTDDFYRLIAADYEAHRQAGGHPGKELAAKYSTHPGNVSKWLKAARERGFLTETKEEES